jgi:Tol biopolymer transport system component
MKTLRKWQIVAVAALGLMLVRTPDVQGDFMFGTPRNLGPEVNSSDSEYDPSISADGLELYFQSNRSGGYGDRDLYVVTRATTQDNWSEPVNLGPILNSSARDAGPEISSDGLSLYFNSNRPGGSGNYDLYVTTRQNISEPWGSPVNLGPSVNTTADEISSSISADGLSLFFSDGDALGTVARSGGYGGADIWVAQRTSPSDAWGPPTNLGAEINLSFVAGAPEISSDGQTLFFSGYRPSTGGTNDLWLARRNAIDAQWGAPVNLGPAVNSDADADLNPSISADGRMLYFASFRPGGSGNSDLWQVPVKPIVDLNGDGFVDTADVCIMVDHWGTNESLCDIGPMPFGDGIVDVRDMIVLAEHLFEEILPAELIAYWKLNETKGTVAYDSAGEHDGLLNGDPQWQPAGGQVAGALELDGIDDYVGTDCVFNPMNGPFSAFAWIKGGAPGQVIISQTDGAGSGDIWLGMEESSGKLMSGLVPPPAGRLVATPLRSECVVTDGQWHHVGFVWDCSYRYLYVDGVEAARDTMAWKGSPMKSSDGGLCIGADKALNPGTFFSGVLDDIRIYDKALSTWEIEALLQ